MGDIETRIHEIVAVELQIDGSRVSPEAVLLDLGMDSVSALNIMFAVEEAFGIEAIDINEVSKIKTVADLGRVVRDMMPRSAAMNP